jgi:predicted nucleic acid-binding Zn ribbon protein
MSRKKRTKGPLTSVSEILSSVMTGLEMPEDIELKGKAFLAWEEAAGDAASHSRPFRFRGSTLIVEVTEPAWINELSMRKTDIVNRLERTVGERVVEDIRFEIKKKRPLE